MGPVSDYDDTLYFCGVNTITTYAFPPIILLRGMHTLRP